MFIYILLVLYIILSVGNLDPLFIIDDYNGTHLYVIALSYIIILYYLFKKKTFVKIFSIIKIPFFIFLFIPLLSTILSNSFLDSLMSLLGLLNTLIISIFIAEKYSPLKFIKVITISGFIVFIIILLLIFVFPDSVIDTRVHIGAWKGIYAHKNILGLFSLLYFASSLYLFIVYKKISIVKLFYFFNMSFSLLLIINSRSKTALAFSLIVLISVVIVKLAKSTKINFIKLLFFLIVFIFMVAFMTNNITVGNLASASDYISIFGIEIPLTGRLTIWAFSLFKLTPYLYFGYGYNAFWGVSSSANMSELGLGDFSIGDSHNGIINALLSFGIVGTTMIVLFMIYITLLYYKYYVLNRKSFISFLYLYLWIVFLLTNITESTLYKSTNLYQFICFYLIFSFYLHVYTSSKLKGKNDKFNY